MIRRPTQTTLKSRDHTDYEGRDMHPGIPQTKRYAGKDIQKHARVLVSEAMIHEGVQLRAPITSRLSCKVFIYSNNIHARDVYGL